MIILENMKQITLGLEMGPDESTCGISKLLWLRKIFEFSCFRFRNEGNEQKSTTHPTVPSEQLIEIPVSDVHDRSRIRFRVYCYFFCGLCTYIAPDVTYRLHTVFVRVSCV